MGQADVPLPRVLPRRAMGRARPRARAIASLRRLDGHAVRRALRLVAGEPVLGEEGERLADREELLGIGVLEPEGSVPRAFELLSIGVA